jgi:hypothetical protein
MIFINPLRFCIESATDADDADVEPQSIAPWALQRQPRALSIVAPARRENDQKDPTSNVSIYEMNYK